MEQKNIDSIEDAIQAFNRMANDDVVITPEGMRDLAMNLRQVLIDDMETLETLETSEPDEYVLKAEIMHPKPEYYHAHDNTSVSVPKDALDVQLIIEREFGPTSPVKEYKMVWLEKVRRE